MTTFWGSLAGFTGGIHSKDEKPDGFDSINHYIKKYKKGADIRASAIRKIDLKLEEVLTEEFKAEVVKQNQLIVKIAKSLQDNK